MFGISSLMLWNGQSKRNLFLAYGLTLWLSWVQSNYLARRFELSYCTILPLCKGSCWDAQLEGIVRKRPGMLPILFDVVFIFTCYLFGAFFLMYQRFLSTNSKNCSSWTIVEYLQLRIEQRRGHVFEGWNEGRIYFPPTYKYSNNSDRYAGDDTHPKEKRRTPAW